MISMANPRFGSLRSLNTVLLCVLLFWTTEFFADAYHEDNNGNEETAVSQEDPNSDHKTVLGGAAAVNAANVATRNAAVDESSQLCNADMSSFLPPPYSNITRLVCSPVWNNYVLRYHKGDENVVTFILSAVYTTGWVGMGFSKDGMMVGSTAMVGWFNKKGEPRIKEYYLQGTSPSQVIAESGELDLTKIPPAVVVHQSMIYLAFQAKFQKPLARQPILLAFGTRYPNHHHLSRHDDRTAIVFDFSRGSASASASGADSNIGGMIKNHGVLGILAWALFLPVGAIIARYMKHKDPLWYYLHAGIQLVGFLFGLATVVLGLQIYSKINIHIPAHRGIGIFVLFLSILQILAFFLRPNKDAKIRKYWNWYHHWFGRIALFFGATNVLLGIQLAGAGAALKGSFGFLITVILLSVIILETLSFMRRRSEDFASPPTFQMNQV